MMAKQPQSEIESLVKDAIEDGDLRGFLDAMLDPSRLPFEGLLVRNSIRI